MSPAEFQCLDWLSLGQINFVRWKIYMNRLELNVRDFYIVYYKTAAILFITKSSTIVWESEVNSWL